MYPETVICLAYARKKCEFWHPYLRGTLNPSLWYSQILSNFIFSYLPILKNFISPVFQFWILESLFEGDPFILVPPNFVKFYLIFILSILKISSVQRKWLNFGFWRPRLKRILSFWYHQILSNFIFSWFLRILKISCVLHEWLKSWILAAPFEGYPPFWYAQILSNIIFSLYLPTLKTSCV